MPAGPTAFRCSGCDINWPPRADFEVCPACDEGTWPAPGEEPISAQFANLKVAVAAERRKRQEAFEGYLQAQEAERMAGEVLADLAGLPVSQDEPSL